MTSPDQLLALAARVKAGSEAKLCEACGNPFGRHGHDSVAAWNARRFCCHACSLKPRRTTCERFEALFVPEPMSGCWLWTGALDKYGYGTFRTWPETEHAHRASWRLNKGQIEEGLWALHRCDVRCCVNPDHLFLGDNDANVADRVAKGRTRQGETHPRAKVSAANVLAILSDARPIQTIADEYGIGIGQIHNIKNGQTWNSVTGLPKVGRVLPDHLRQRRRSHRQDGVQ